MTTLSFFAHGTPAPQGSKNAFYSPKLGRAIVTEKNPTAVKAWRNDVVRAALQARGDDWTPYDQPCTVVLLFYFTRPKAHFRTGRNANLLRDGAPLWHITKPDLDKLTRSTLDAITAAGIWRDDSLAASINASKRYIGHDGPDAGAIIEITPRFEHAVTPLSVNAEQGVLL